MTPGVSRVLISKLNRVFAQTLEDADHGVVQLKSEQQDWIDERFECGSDAECTEKRYMGRIDELKNFAAGKEGITSDTLCEKTRRIARKKEFGQYSVPSGDGGIQYVNYKGIDLDGDGKSDEVKVDSGSYESTLIVRKSSGGGFVHSNGIMRLIRLKNELLVIGVYREPGSSDMYPAYYDVSSLKSEGVKKICDFEISRD